MNRRNQRRSARPLTRTSLPSRRAWPWLILILLILTIVAASTGDHGLIRLFKLRGSHARILERNAELEADNARLAQEVKRLREDRHALEKIAREELGMVRPEEIVYQVGP